MTQLHDLNSSAQLYGNGHKKTGNSNKPLFNTMIVSIYNITIDVYLANRFENG